MCSCLLYLRVIPLCVCVCVCVCACVCMCAYVYVQFYFFSYELSQDIEYTSLVYIVFIQSLSCVRLFVTPWTTACQASLSFTISQSLLKLRSIDSAMPSNHLILCHPLLLLPSIFPRIRVFSSESVLHFRWPKYWGFSFSIRVDFLQDGLVGSSCCPRDSQESSPAPQFESINSSVLSLLCNPTLTSIHDYWKNHRWTFVGKVMALFLICCVGWLQLFFQRASIF